MSPLVSSADGAVNVNSPDPVSIASRIASAHKSAQEGGGGTIGAGATTSANASIGKFLKSERGKRDTG